MEIKAADRILAAVGNGNLPPNVDKTAMISGLNLCAQWYREANRYRTSKMERQRRIRLSRISKTAKLLERLLADDDGQKLYERDSLCARLGQNGDDPRRSLAKAIELAERHLLSIERGSGPEEPYQRSFRKWSPFEWLVGRWLPLVYIGLELPDPGSRKALLAKDSPFLRFVIATLAELKITKAGKPYSRQSIVKAVDLPFSGRPSATPGDWISARQLLLVATPAPEKGHEPSPPQGRW